MCAFACFVCKLSSNLLSCFLSYAAVTKTYLYSCDVKRELNTNLKWFSCKIRDSFHLVCIVFKCKLRYYYPASYTNHYDMVCVLMDLADVHANHSIRTESHLVKLRPYPRTVVTIVYYLLLLSLTPIWNTSYASMLKGIEPRPLYATRRAHFTPFHLHTQLN